MNCFCESKHIGFSSFWWILCFRCINENLQAMDIADFLIYIIYSLEFDSEWFWHSPCTQCRLTSLQGFRSDYWVLAIAPVLWSQKSLLAVSTLFPLLTVYVVKSTSMRALSLQIDVACQRSISSERSMCQVVDVSLSWVVTQVTGIEATTPGLGGSDPLINNILLMCRSWGWKKRLRIPQGYCITLWSTSDL